MWWHSARGPKLCVCMGDEAISTSTSYALNLSCISIAYINVAANTVLLVSLSLSLSHSIVLKNILATTENEALNESNSDDDNVLGYHFQSVCTHLRPIHIIYCEIIFCTGFCWLVMMMMMMMLRLLSSSLLFFFAHISNQPSLKYLAVSCKGWASGLSVLNSIHISENILRWATSELPGFIIWIQNNLKRLDRHGFIIDERINRIFHV